MIHALFDTIGVPVLVVIFLVLFVLEMKFQLRNRVQLRFKRILINSIVSLPAFTLLRFLMLPVFVWLCQLNLSYRFGLIYLFDFPYWAETIIVFLVLDYGNYLWHWLNHKFIFLWRFHLVHHTDHDLDITTAFRFHFGEMIGSVFFRGAINFLSGATPTQVIVYEILFEAATQFHHSNLKLPVSFEKFLNYFIVTPRMHGIHHSVVKAETDSNYSVIFSLWDRLHGTMKTNISHDSIVIGEPSYSNPDELTVGYLLKMPFRKIRRSK
jgi:sterol desaturase/sphingolipid hydroxylase (fatty acid hydroxylase superfamily)